MPSKAYNSIKQAVPTETVALDVAVKFLKDHRRPSFDETIELHVRLGVDPSKSEQMVRGSFQLPAGATKQQRIVVFCEDVKRQDQAKEAGATQIGGAELLEEIAGTGKIEADITIATPAIMAKISTVAKILGPKGLMPSPKTGTVTDDPAAAVAELRSGKVSFKMDQLGNIHLPIAKSSWASDKIITNVQAALTAITSLRPASAKGEFMRSITLKSTMSPALRVTI